MSGENILEKALEFINNEKHKEWRLMFIPNHMAIRLKKKSKFIASKITKIPKMKYDLYEFTYDGSTRWNIIQFKKGDYMLRIQWKRNAGYLYISKDWLKT
jgi:hypothetical protein